MRRLIGEINGVKIYADDALNNTNCIVLDGGWRELIDLRVRGDQVQMTMRLHPDRLRVFRNVAAPSTEEE